jgi:hypothetical protein
MVSSIPSGSKYRTFIMQVSIIAFVRGHCIEYDHLYLILHSVPGGYEEWERRLGPFIANVVAGCLQDYPGIVFGRRLNDAYVYELRCYF